VSADREAAVEGQSVGGVADVVVDLHGLEHVSALSVARRAKTISASPCI
jgi:hypothetical protein